MSSMPKICKTNEYTDVSSWRQHEEPETDTPNVDFFTTIFCTHDHEYLQQCCDEMLTMLEDKFSIFKESGSKRMQHKEFRMNLMPSLRLHRNHWDLFAEFLILVVFAYVRPAFDRVMALTTDKVRVDIFRQRLLHELNFYTYGRSNPQGPFDVPKYADYQIFVVEMAHIYLSTPFTYGRSGRDPPETTTVAEVAAIFNRVHGTRSRFNTSTQLPTTYHHVTAVVNEEGDQTDV